MLSPCGMYLESKLRTIKENLDLEMRPLLGIEHNIHVHIIDTLNIRSVDYNIDNDLVCVYS